MRHLSYTAASVTLGVALIWQATDGLRAITAEGARRVQVTDNPRPVPQVALETMQGDWRALSGASPTLVEFIYTTCPTICQTSGGDFAELRDHLSEAGLSVPMYSISFDPEVDDLPELQAYAALHTASGSPWTIARPEPGDLPHLLETFQVTVIPDGWGGYEHNIAVLLIDRDGNFSGVFDTRAFDQITDAVEAAF